MRAESQRVLMRFMLLSLATALATMGVKALAAVVTGSVGLLSDAMESLVNLIAAVVGVLALRAAGRPADENHHFGHGKAEYLSAAVEGAMIFVTSGFIVWTSVRRLLHPVALDTPGLGLALSSAAALLNLGVGVALVRAGGRHRSPALVADGRHLLTDVWTSGGVLVGIAVVALTGWGRLDPLVALLVGLNILRTGYELLRRSVVALLDAALPAEDAARVEAVMNRFRAVEPVEFQAARTRESGRYQFVYVTMLVPEEWTVQRAHDVADRLERDVAAELPGATTFVHVEPRP